MVSIEVAPKRMNTAHFYIFTEPALNYLKEFVTEFEHDYDQLMIQRRKRSIAISENKFRPQFKNVHRDKSWTIDPLPARLKNRKLDLGDCSPSNTISFIDALNENVQGIQVDFDDGHCPTWKNQIQGLYNIAKATRSTLNGMLYQIQDSPILMFRPRAFNMIEHHCMVKGKKIPGAFFDFALLTFHNARLLEANSVGPYFYLSKIESAEEAKLWDRIFTWTEKRLELPHGTIKACILIENILAAFEMDDILYAIRHHAIGLNCGIWDYSASIIAKFGNRKEYLIPDRNKYVNVDQLFLKNYIKLVISTCHRRKAIATGGMAAKILTENPGSKESLDIIEGVKSAKLAEILMGVDGFMVYDLRLVPHINKLWYENCKLENQIHIFPDTQDVSAKSLLQIPAGGVTMEGLRHNISVAFLFIYHWLCGQGVFHYNNSVEDSATAEISRSQVWQWIRHGALIEGTSDKVTSRLVYEELENIIKSLGKILADHKRVSSSKFLLLEIVTAREPPEFITTFLNDLHKFNALHNKMDGLQAKL